MTAGRSLVNAKHSSPAQSGRQQRPQLNSGLRAKTRNYEGSVGAYMLATSQLCARSLNYKFCLSLALSALVWATSPMSARGQLDLDEAADAPDLTSALADEKAAEVHEAVDRGLEWLSTQQNEDGAFSSVQRPRHAGGPNATITAYAVLAFLSRGERPGVGRHGRLMSRAIDYILSLQRDDGSISHLPATEPLANYEHPLCGVMLSEVYGSTTGGQAERISRTIERALAYSRSAQFSADRLSGHQGGWGYSRPDACVPTTAWELMFLRSAHNAGFNVPKQWVDEGIAFIARCYSARAQGAGVFRFNRGKGWSNSNTTGAGALALQLHGRRDDPMVRGCVEWIKSRGVPRQGQIPRVYYGYYFCSQAMAQRGGVDWNEYFPRLVDRLLAYQSREGYWELKQPGGNRGEELLGNSYNTALAVLCLTLPDQLLPIHQR